MLAVCLFVQVARLRSVILRQLDTGLHLVFVRALAPLGIPL